MPVGKVKVWLESRGFGFIVTEGNSPDIFVHLSQISFRPIRQGDVVEFALEFDPLDRPRAARVRRAITGATLSMWEDVPEVRAREARKVFSEAIIARNEKRYGEARQLFEKAISLTPERNFFEAYAAMERNLGNWERVETIYNQARENFPGDVGILEMLAMAKKKRAEVTKERTKDSNICTRFLIEAIKLLREAIQQQPNRVTLHLHLAELLVSLAEESKNFLLLEEARNHFTEAYSLHSKGDIRERSSYNKMWILHQNRSRAVWYLLREAGFEIIKWRIEFTSEKIPAPSYAWFLVSAKNYRNSEAFSLDGKLFVNCPYHAQVTQSQVRAAEVLHKQLCAEDASIKHDLFFIVTDSEQLENYLRMLLEDPESHPTVVPLDQPSVESALLQENEVLHTYFDQLLTKWVHRRDLYKGNHPVSGRRFFGREREIGLLNQSVEEGRCIGIFGLRKSGKTSLLLQLKSIRKGDIVTYIDPEASAATTATWICWRVVQDWGKHSKGNFFLARYHSERDLPNFAEVSKDFVSDARNLLSQNSYDSKCVILIDEIEKVVPPMGEPWEGAIDLFRILRGLVQESNGRLVVFICGANPAICERPQWHQQDNPVFQFFEEMFLPLLAETECKEMIVSLGKGMGVYYDEQALDFIHELSGGHPFLTRRLCSVLANRYPQRPLQVSVDILKSLEDEFLIGSHEVFLEIKERLKRDYPQEWDLLEALVSGFSIDEVKQLIPNWPIAVRHLEGYQLISRSGGGVTFQMKLFERWLRCGGVE
ncbi:MAG: cold shock domain-containing protein [Fimbriimonadales bacterium]|nr:MAG: hypothetical protein KatS3mg018_0106 [Fimbriimonadales bacterium]